MRATSKIIQSRNSGFLVLCAIWGSNRVAASFEGAPFRIDKENCSAVIAKPDSEFPEPVDCRSLCDFVAAQNGSLDIDPNSNSVELQRLLSFYTQCGFPARETPAAPRVRPGGCRGHGGDCWGFAWPAGSGGNCECERDDLRGSYSTQADCVHAMSESPRESCVVSGPKVSLTLNQCAHAVLRDSPAALNLTEVNNSECSARCLAAVKTQAEADFAKFYQVCAIETASARRGQVIPESIGADKCFSNMIYGWSESRLAGFSAYHEISSAAECQTMCQTHVDCSYFQFRQIPGLLVPTTHHLPSSAGTCTLKTKGQVEAAVSALDAASCDRNSLSLVSKLYPNLIVGLGCKAPCMWMDPSFVSGPKFCGPTTSIL